MVAEGLARRTVVALFLCEALLSALHAGVANNADIPRGFVEFGHLDSETSLATWFSSMQFAALALVLFALWRREGGLWLLLAAGALFLSADEAAGIHEKFGSLVRHEVSRGVPGTFRGWLRLEYPSYYWALLYVPLAVPAAAVVARFLWIRLERHRSAILWGIGIFFAGAVGLDFLEGWLGTEAHGPLQAGSLLVDVVVLEEVLEMLGVTLVLAACLEHAARRFGLPEGGDPAPPRRSDTVTPGAENG